MQGRKIIFTGYPGFIGKRLVRRLAEQGRTGRERLVAEWIMPETRVYDASIVVESYRQYRLTGKIFNLAHVAAAGLDLLTVARPYLRALRDRLNEILATHCKQTLEKVKSDTDRDFIMGADEAKVYGLVDQVVAKRER